MKSRSGRSYVVKSCLVYLVSFCIIATLGAPAAPPSGRRTSWMHTERWMTSTIARGRWHPTPRREGSSTISAPRSVGTGSGLPNP